MSGISTFERKTFRVQAVQITVQNMKTISEWCGGGFKAPEAPGRRAYVTVPSGRGNVMRAYVGDWITRLSDGNSCRVYKDKSFREAFKGILTEQEKRDQVRKIMERAAMASGPDVDVIVNSYTEKIMSIIS